MQTKHNLTTPSKCAAALLLAAFAITADAQQTVFKRDFSPAEGIITPDEKPYREEICLNGYWLLQPKEVPQSWKSGTGTAPELPPPTADGWEETRLKVPSPINVNDWGRGYKTGEGTKNPYTPSSVYFPSYPERWNNVRMGWLKRTFNVPREWDGKRIVLHFEAVAGDCVVMVNGREVCRNFDSHLPFEADITAAVSTGGDNELLVGVRHSKLFDKVHPDYPKMAATYPPGSNTDNLIGIWQDVYLWAMPATYVDDVFVQPLVDRGELVMEVTVANRSAKAQTVTVGGEAKEWLNHAGNNVLTAPEPSWSLGKSALTVPDAPKMKIPAGQSRTFTIRQPINGELAFWTPDTPNLYTLLLQLKDKKGRTIDCKATRFGWRQLKIVGDEFRLNGKKIQCFGDIQHPFSAYICSRRFAYAWYKMIKDFGGNAVRPHAQPWPRVYYDLADEMGLMVLDETALFGSSIRLNFEDNMTWKRAHEHLRRLIMRDRNHPSVIGWSAGNETFAIALLNKPPKEMAAKWDDKLVQLTLSAKATDPTRNFITLDGDRDMDGRLPVWSKHFSHGLRLQDLPEGIGKPLVVGESGATYYGKPAQLYPFVGEKAYLSYEGRSEALAIDVYQNVQQMAKPYLAYYSPSEVCWFGLEHMNLGYHDFSRLPRLTDGVFAGNPYVEGKPGYQYERIPPYVTTFNPGLDPELPLYKPLPMFNALKAAVTGNGTWAEYKEVKHPQRPAFPETAYGTAYLAGNGSAELRDFLARSGITLAGKPEDTRLWIVDADAVTAEEMAGMAAVMEKNRNSGGLLLALGTGEKLSPALCGWLPETVTLTDRQSTSLEVDRQTAWGRYFELPDLYFSEAEGDRRVMKHGLATGKDSKGTVVLKAARTDWSLFNNTAEHWKCAQTVLYEKLKKPEGAALLTYPYGKATIALSVIDYRPKAKEYAAFWQLLFKAMGIDVNPDKGKGQQGKRKEHDLLMDGPVD